MISIHQIETITIRPMESSDLDQVDALEKLSFSLPWPKSAFEYELLENPQSMLWVADTSYQSQKRVLGMIVVWLILDEAHIASLAVHPDYRGQGIAQELIIRSLKAIQLRGAVSATLEVRENNKAALQLYHNMGFEVVGRRLRYYRDNNEDAIIMTLHQLEKKVKCWNQHPITINKLSQDSPVEPENH